MKVNIFPIVSSLHKEDKISLEKNYYNNDKNFVFNTILYDEKNMARFIKIDCEGNVSYISLKSDKVRKLIDGKPTTIIKAGKIKFNEYVYKGMVQPFENYVTGAVGDLVLSVLDTGGGDFFIEMTFQPAVVFFDDLDRIR
mgnify:CR=1 FL=1